MVEKEKSCVLVLKIIFVLKKEADVIPT